MLPVIASDWKIGIKLPGATNRNFDIAGQRKIEACREHKNKEINEAKK